MKDALSVEIFRATDCRNADPEVAEHGLDLVRRHTAGLEIVRRTRLLKLAIDDGVALNINSVRWPRFEADINLILTNRQLVSKDQTNLEVTVGYAARDRGAAVIMHKEGAYTTVAHETGHLLGLKHGGAKFDGESHCADPDCMMHKYSKMLEDTERVKKHGVKGWLERRGYAPAEYTEISRPASETFCDECASQLGYNAFWLIKHKNGETVPNDFISTFNQ